MTRTYLDASVLVALMTNDPLTPTADAFLRNHQVIPVVSDFAAAELTSALARRVRTAELTKDEAAAALTGLDHWLRHVASRVLLTTTDIAAADMVMRRFDLSLRTPDALHIAVCRRVGTALATFDAKMAVCATALGLTLAPA